MQLIHKMGRRLVIPLLSVAALLGGSANAAAAAPSSAAADTLAVTSRLVRISQVSTNRFLDAHEVASNDFNVVTRTFQNNRTQEWVITDPGVQVNTIQQVSSGRCLAAYETSDKDWQVTTRPCNGQPNQRWYIVNV